MKFPVSVLILLGCSWCCFQQAAAQQGTKVAIQVAPSGSADKSPEMYSPLGGIITPGTANAMWQPVLIPPPLISKNEGSNDGEIQQIKQEKLLQKLANRGTYPPVAEFSDPGVDELPVVGINFEGNADGGCPPDNTIAISNGGFIVSCVNSNIYMFNQSGASLGSITLYDFFSPLNPTVNLCDPKVIYDPGADRFILFTQGCDGFAIPNQVLLAFSQTNNPTNSWWVYGLTGDPLGNNSWLDYPKIGISNNEFYLTGNLYSSSGNYVQSVIYQITKASGYGGNNSLQWQFWSNIAGNPFTLQPLSWGHGSTYGPGIYLVASRSGGGNIIQFYDLTNDMTASNETLNYMPVTVDAYTVPPPGLQPNGLYMDTGDNRMMDGFYLNGTAHFVFSEAKGDWSAIRYNRLDVANLAYQYQQTYNTGVRDYSYGSVASFTNDPSDKTVLVGFVAVGESNAPEYRVKYYGDNMETASSILVKGGTGSVSANFCYDPDREFVRWGDYTGMSRKHNSSNPKIWTSSCFGKSNGSWGTWIAEINDDGNVPVLENDGPAIGLNVAPNPASNGRFTVNVRVEAIEEADFKLIDQQGKTVANLYRGHLLPGENQFSFLQDALATGAYYLVITSTSTHKILANEKVMVTH